MHFILSNEGGQLISATAFPHYGGAGGSMTDLQRHVEFFDKNKDGVITLTESIKGASLMVFKSCGPKI